MATPLTLFLSATLDWVEVGVLVEDSLEEEELDEEELDEEDSELDEEELDEEELGDEVATVLVLKNINMR